MNLCNEDQAQMAALEGAETIMHSTCYGSWINHENAVALVDILMDAEVDPEFTTLLAIEFLEKERPFNQVFFFTNSDDTELQFWNIQTRMWEPVEWTN